MSTSYGDWQPGHLQLGAPELYVLLHGPDANASEVFKLALHELIGRGSLAVDRFDQGSGETAMSTPIMLPGPASPDDLSRSLRSVMDAYQSLPKQTSVDDGTGVAVQNLARALRERHEGELSQWVKDEVVATLVERNLYTEEETKRLGLFKTTNYEPTAEGKAAQAALEASIERAEDQFGGWADNDAARAGTFLAVAGPGVLLTPNLRPALERLQSEPPGIQKMMDVGAETVSDIADPGFDIFRLLKASDALKILDLTIDYGRLDSDPASSGGE